MHHSIVHTHTHTSHTHTYTHSDIRTITHYPSGIILSSQNWFSIVPSPVFPTGWFWFRFHHLRFWFHLQSWLRGGTDGPHGCSSDSPSVLPLLFQFLPIQFSLEVSLDLGGTWTSSNYLHSHPSLPSPSFFFSPAYYLPLPPLPIPSPTLRAAIFLLLSSWFSTSRWLGILCWMRLRSW